ncbi:MAG: HAD-IA family hydrolase [Pseudomonadales bacterium]|nr:HAD-IA family hydrolase [Pseudomonadales bacterium]
MPKPLEAVLFDLDGTLLDTAPDFIGVLRTLLEEQNLPTTLTNAQIRSQVSHGAAAMVSLGFNMNRQHPQFESLRLRFLELYAARLSQSTRLFPGMEELLQAIEKQGLPWGIVTNKPLRYATPLLENLNLSDRCSTLICPEHVQKPKPAPEPMLLACEQISCNPHNTVYIGDHRRDIEAGNHANMQTIAVLYGYIDENDPAESRKADILVDTVIQLTSWFGQQFAAAPAS